MRICLISREYPPDSGWGGIATYTYLQARGLTEIGHEVEVISLASAGATEESSVNQDGVRVHRVLWTDFLDGMQMLHAATPFSHYVIKTIFALSKKFLSIHERTPFDLVEAPEHLAEGLGLALTRKLPLVVRLHTPQSKLITEQFHNLTPSFDQLLVAMMERYAMLCSDTITSPSENMADYVAQDISYPRSDIHIVRNPVDSAQFCPEGPKALPSNGKSTVLFVGRLEQRKGIHFLIDAVPQILAAYPQVRFVVIGSDTNNGIDQGSVLAELKRSLAHKGALESVTFIPHIPLTDISDYYRSADICVIPSLYDNAPCTCLEAMSTGKPVVATSAGGTSEYAIHGECGLIVPPRDTNALAGAITELLGNAHMRSTMGHHGRSRVLQNFGHQTIARQSIEIYEQAIERHAKTLSHPLYGKSEPPLIDDVSIVLQSYDKMLYNLLYMKSWDFRTKHRFKRASSLVAQVMRTF